MTREAFARGLLTEGEEWMEMIESRNMTSHAYNSDTADAIAEAILSRYVPQFRRLLETLRQLEGDGE